MKLIHCELHKFKKFSAIILFNILYHLLPQKGKVMPGKEFGICSLLCHRDLKMFIYGLKSLFFQLNREFRVYIVNDGTLTIEDKELLNYFFYVHIEDSTSTELKMRNLLVKYPYIQKYRFNDKLSNLKLKLDAWFLNGFSRFIYIDADILFYRYPNEINKWIVNDSDYSMYIAHTEEYFRDKYYLEFSLRKLLYKHMHLKMTAGFNSGLLLIRSKDVLNLDNFNKILRYLNQICLITFGGLEECLMSVIMADVKSKKLSQKLGLKL